MRNPTADHLDSVFELTLAGDIGPVLRKAFGACGASAAHVCTVVRAKAPRAVDLVDLMADLDAHGLQVELIAGT